MLYNFGPIYFSILPPKVSVILLRVFYYLYIEHYKYWTLIILNAKFLSIRHFFYFYIEQLKERASIVTDFWLVNWFDFLLFSLFSFLFQIHFIFVKFFKKTVQFFNFNLAISSSPKRDSIKLSKKKKSIKRVVVAQWIHLDLFLILL